jgi:hypothetical protein
MTVRKLFPQASTVAVSNDWFPPPASAWTTVPPLSALASFFALLGTAHVRFILKLLFSVKALTSGGRLGKISVHNRLA